MRYKVLAAKCGVGAGGFACGPVSGPVIGEIKLADENGSEFYLCLVEVDGIANWFKTDRSTIDDQLSEDAEESLYDYLNERDLSLGEYVDVLYEKEDELYQAYRYLIYLVRCEMEKVEPFIQATVGKYLDEMDIPMSDIEEDLSEEYDGEDDEEPALPEGIELELPEDKELLFRLCLAYSAEHEVESVFKDLSAEDVAVNEYILKEVRKVINADEYEVWKQNYLETEYSKLKSHGFLAVSYMFAGVGGYDDVIPEEQFESFICWINGNGSAFFTGKREATEEEIKMYIARHAYDNGPDVVSYE